MFSLPTSRTPSARRRVARTKFWLDRHSLKPSTVFTHAVANRPNVVNVLGNKEDRERLRQTIREAEIMHKLQIKRLLPLPVISLNTVNVRAPYRISVTEFLTVRHPRHGIFLLGGDIYASHVQILVQEANSDNNERRKIHVLVYLFFDAPESVILNSNLARSYFAIPAQKISKNTFPILPFQRAIEAVPEGLPDNYEEISGVTDSYEAERSRREEELDLIRKAVAEGDMLEITDAGPVWDGPERPKTHVDTVLLLLLLSKSKKFRAAGHRPW
ncbi:hypothetical protein EDD85DRAFT_784511 [Armillaria nabsnona]|nr:hypothetical protein EDD85DRAFT_784511 [Armillaria nabsnona]